MYMYAGLPESTPVCDAFGENCTTTDSLFQTPTEVMVACNCYQRCNGYQFRIVGEDKIRYSLGNLLYCASYSEWIILAGLLQCFSVERSNTSRSRFLNYCVKSLVIGSSFCPNKSHARVQAFVYYRDNIITRRTEQEVYPFSEMMIEFAAIAGLYFGFSMLTIAFFISFTVEWVQEKHNRIRYGKEIRLASNFKYYLKLVHKL